MSGILPRGLINITNTQISHATPTEPLHERAQVLHRFWKVHAVKRSLTQDAADVRAENLFWRVWSSPGLSQAIAAPVLTSLWQTCGHQFDLTAFQLQLLSIVESPSTEWQAETSSLGASDSAPSPPNVSHVASQTPPLERRDTNEGSSLEDRPQPPFEYALKKSRQEDNSIDNAPQVPANDPAMTDTMSQNNSPRPNLGRTVSGSRKRATVMAGGGRARTRPQLGRRKSSQTAAHLLPEQPRSPKPSSKTASKASEVQRSAGMMDQNLFMQAPPGLPTIPLDTSKSTFVLPSASSWQSDDLTLPGNSSAEVNAGLSRSLVDPNFRGRFVASQKNIPSATNLAGMGRIKQTGSVVRFAEEVSNDRNSPTRRNQVPRVENEAISQPSQHGGTQSLSSADGCVEDDESDDDGDLTITLPRNKSHLSLLINDERRQSGSHDLPPMSPSTKPPGRGGDKMSDAEKLLAMARRDGVTKAGGVQFSGPRRVSGSPEHEYRPATPPPIF